MHVVEAGDPRSTERVAGVLATEGVVIVPTDTLYGFAAAISSRSAQTRIAAIKGSSKERRFLYVASSLKMVKRFIASWGCADERRLAAVWPAPLTGVFACGGDAPQWMEETIALRVPSNVWLRKAIDALGEPIASTSVNRSGESPLSELDAIKKQFGREVDVVVNGEPGGGGAPSTIVDFTGREAVVVRAGAYPWAT